jgi:hypothetical protein
MMLRPQACFLASDNCTISKKRGVIGSQHGESLCLLLVDVKIIMSTLNNDGINLSITAPCHRIGAVGVGVAEVQPPPVQHRHVVLVVVAAAATRPPPHRRHRGGTGRVDPPRRRRVGSSRRRRGGRRCLGRCLGHDCHCYYRHRHLRHDLSRHLRNRRRRRRRCGGGGGGRRVFVNFVVTAPVHPFRAVGLTVLLEDS